MEKTCILHVTIKIAIQKAFSQKLAIRNQGFQYWFKNTEPQNFP